MDLNYLNPPQREAVQYTDGQLLILAGAGSGKTRVIACRAAYILEKGLAGPGEILSITFTNKAAKELKERIIAMAGPQGEYVWAMTFHSFCVRVLRQDIDRLGYSSAYTIYDTADQKSVVKECYRELNINDKIYPEKMTLELISDAKNKLIDADTYFKENYGDFKLGAVARIYKLYQEKLRGYNAVDFDDIIMLTVQLFEEHDDILLKWSRRFRYIMVDEYQDTNGAQYKLISQLSSFHGNLCAVGDDDQSIYGWRGADITNILDFEKQYKDCKTIKLEQNYRSTANILEAANSVIKNNYGRKDKTLWTDKGGGALIKLNCSDTEHDEASYIVKSINSEIEGGRKYGDFAVLYRTNAQSRVIEEAFNRSRIPYKIIGGHKFYDRKEVKDVLAYLRLMANPSDNVAFKRTINVPKRGIGDATVTKIEDMAAAGATSMYDAVRSNEAGDVLQRAAQKVRAFTELIDELCECMINSTISTLMDTVIRRSGIVRELEAENTPEANARIENINELVNVAAEFEKSEDIEDKSLESFLSGIQLTSDIDEAEEQEESVLMMTMHSAKGLEYPVVYIVGMEESIFPGNRAIGDDIQMEEERRLCYVGITRAKEALHLLHAKCRMQYGKTTYNRRSRFIGEIPNDLIENVQEKAENVHYSHLQSGNTAEFFGAKKNFGIQLNSAASVKSALTSVKVGHGSGETVECIFDAGDRVNHKKFGDGTVVSVTQDKGDYLIEIQFDVFGMKRMLLSMAKLSKI